MIELFQHQISINNAVTSSLKLNDFKVHINAELVIKDLDRLNLMYKYPKNKFDKKNIKALTKYLSKLLDSLDEKGNLELCWCENEDTILNTYPFNLIKEPAYMINSSDYISVNDTHYLLEIDTTDIADLISFEFMYRDLGETHDTVEEILSKCGIIGFEDSKMLTDMFKESGDHMFELSKTLSVEDSPYYNQEERFMRDYFNSKEFKSINYRDSVNYSARYANLIIADDIIRKAAKFDINCKLVMLDATGLTMVIPKKKGLDIKRDLIDKTSIRTFGRRFVVEPNVSVY